MPTQLPFSQDNNTHAFQPHHTVRRYAHRVRGSLTTRASKILCAITLTLLFILGLIAFILWISLRPHRPRVYIRNFSIPGLGQPHAFKNAQIIFNVTCRNSNKNIGFYYDSMVGSVYYKGLKIGSSPLLQRFYQEPKNTRVINKVLSGTTLTVNNKRWSEFFNDRRHGNVVFRLDITATIQFKMASWESKHHRMHADCDVSVGQDGLILANSRDKRCLVYFT